MQKQGSKKVLLNNRWLYFGLLVLSDLILSLLILWFGLHWIYWVIKFCIYGLGIFLYHQFMIFPYSRKQMWQQLEYINTLERISRILVSDLNFEDIYQQLAPELQKVVEFSDFLIYLLDDKSQTYEVFTAQEEVGGNAISRERTFPVNGSSIAEILASGWYRISQESEQSIMQIPLKNQSIIIGVFELKRVGNQGFKEKDYQILSPIVERVAIAAQNCLIYQRSKELSLRDYLTNTGNRRALDQHLEKQYNRARQYDKIFSILVVDIDYFKNINDTYGHLAGDDVLREIAEMMKSVVRGMDMVCRYGGEEFVLILTDTNREQAFLVAERLRTKVADHTFLTGGLEIKLTVSIGVATYSQELDDINELFKGADIKLYAAKKSGRNQVVQLGR